MQGSTALEKNGGWKVLTSDSGMLTFEATAHAYLNTTLSGFVATGKAGTKEGITNYITIGEWIGSIGTVMGPTLSSGTTPPTAAVALSGAAFRTGQTIAYQATLTPGSTPTQVDIYLGALLPDGVTFLSLIQTVPGVISIALGSSPTPFLANVTLNSDLVVPFSYTFTGLEPVGTYFTYAGLAVAGSNPLQPANQLSLGVQAFQFMP